MESPPNYSLKQAALSLFIGLMLGGCIVLATIVMMSLAGINSLVVYDSVAMLGWVGGVVYAGYRAASIEAQGENNAWIIFAIVLVLFIAAGPEGKTFTESFEPFGTQWQRLIKLGLSLPAAMLGVIIRRKQGNPPVSLWELIKTRSPGRGR